MNIGIYGPDWSKTRFSQTESGGWTSEDMLPYQTSAATLGEAILRFEEAFSVSITPYDGSVPGLPLNEGEPRRYFFYSDARFEKMLVDIHIFRGEDELCPKQGLNFPLEDGDIVDVGGPLVC